MINKIVDKKTMTTKEIAIALNVSYDTVNRCVKRIFPDKFQHGKTSYFSETEVAAISRELKNNKSVLSHQTVAVSATVQNSFTGLELQKNFYEASLAYAKFLESENEKLKAENKQLTHALEYDAIVGWKRWTDLKEEWKKDFEELKHRVSFGYLIEKAGLVAEEDYKEKVMGFDKFPTKMISPSGEEKLWNYFDR